MSATSEVTRIEIAQAVQEAFRRRPAPRIRLIETAKGRGARGEVISLLERLPDRGFGHLRELWREMPEVPVGE